MAFERIWFIGDLHLGHRNIIKYCSRPFDDVNQMNEILIQNWNKKIGVEDRVFVLGDFALCGKDKIIEFGNQLKGRKILVLGNHEGASLKTYYEAGFEMVYKYPIYFNNWILSHMPQPNCPCVNIHGHLHQINVDDCLDFEKGEKPYINVSADKINFTPISLKEIEMKIMNSIMGKST